MSGRVLRVERDVNELPTITRRGEVPAPLQSRRTLRTCAAAIARLARTFMRDLATYHSAIPPLNGDGLNSLRRFIRISHGAVILLLLAGCASVPAPSVVVGRAEPVRVEVPVRVPCVDDAQVEAVPPSAMPGRSAGIAELASGAAADAVTYRLLAERQNKMLKACAKKPEDK